eukprot:185603-Rhodomonas_salina.1
MVPFAALGGEEMASGRMISKRWSGQYMKQQLTVRENIARVRESACAVQENKLLFCDVNPQPAIREMAPSRTWNAP